MILFAFQKNWLLINIVQEKKTSIIQLFGQVEVKISKQYRAQYPLKLFNILVLTLAETRSSVLQKNFGKLYLLNIDSEWSFWLTLGARSDFHFRIRILKKWSQNCSTFVTVIFYLLQLWEDSRTPGYNSPNPDHCIQVDLPAPKNPMWEVDERGVTLKYKFFSFFIFITLYSEFDHKLVSWLCEHKFSDVYFCSYHVNERQHFWQHLPLLLKQTEAHQPARWQCWDGHR